MNNEVLLIDFPNMGEGCVFMLHPDDTKPGFWLNGMQFNRFVYKAIDGRTYHCAAVDITTLSDIPAMIDSCDFQPFQTGPNNEH